MGSKDRLDAIVERVGDVQTATLVKAVPEPHAFTYELKWDGYRILGVKAGAAVRLVSRKRQDYTKEMASVARDVATVDADECVLDGEVCALDERGVPSFQLLQNRTRRRSSLVYFVFDLLWLDGEDLRGRPIEERRKLLEQVVLGVNRKGSIVISSASEGDPRAILALACERGLEGIVAKRKGSTYSAGKKPTWLKVKCRARQEFAVIGYLPLMETRDAVGGLLLGVKDSPSGPLHYAGKVGTGFDEKTRVALAKMLEPDRVAQPVVKDVPRFDDIARHVKPRLVAEVEFTEWTEGGHIRHPSFQGLREDKTPDECVKEAPRESASPSTSTRAKKNEDRPEVLGVSISNPSRVLTPTGVTKLELARYYEAVGEHMLPHVKGRPLTLVRWAEGKETEKGGVYLRHAKAWGPDVLRRVKIREKTKLGEYLVADTVAALVGLAQMDILEIHTWSSRADDVEHPDRVVFDLDPAPDVPWKEVVRAAKLVRERLEALGLESWVKTTGGKGLHVLVPLVPEADWDECLGFTRAFAQMMVRDDPKRFVAAVPKHVRSGRILVDYLRNNRTNTSVAAYSTRARPKAPVSVPIAWDELTADLRSDAWNIHTVVDRLRRQRKDPWAGYFRARQRLPRAAR
ncbi:MAG: ligase [Labilithrix sp.]|nr:ligase [Labilithrix sp.]